MPTPLTPSTELFYDLGEDFTRAPLPDPTTEERVLRLTRSVLDSFRTQVEILNPDGTTEPLPRPIIHHSPDGFEWGYGGAGPADLAANILALFVPVKEAMRLHQDYKWHAIAKLPHDQAVLDLSNTVRWLHNQYNPPEQSHTIKR